MSDVYPGKYGSRGFAKGPDQPPPHEGIRNHEMFHVTNDVLALGIYYPKGDRRHDKYSEKILELKNKSDSAVDFFKKLIIAEDLNKLKRMTLCVIPSSTKGKTVTGMTMLAGRIAGSYGGVFGGACLYRKVSIPAAHLGGKRSKALHMETIGVQDTHLIKGKHVALLDDVYTEGVSMDACMELLRENGAAEVVGLVLGRTIRSH